MVHNALTAEDAPTRARAMTYLVPAAVEHVGVGVTSHLLDTYSVMVAAHGWDKSGLNCIALEALVGIGRVGRTLGGIDLPQILRYFEQAGIDTTLSSEIVGGEDVSPLGMADGTSCQSHFLRLLHHQDEGVAMNALGLVCAHAQTTALVSSFEVRVVLNFFTVNVAHLTSSVRQQVGFAHSHVR